MQVCCLSGCGGCLTSLEHKVGVWLQWQIHYRKFKPQSGREESISVISKHLLVAVVCLGCVTATAAGIFYPLIHTSSRCSSSPQQCKTIKAGYCGELPWNVLTTCQVFAAVCSGLKAPKLHIKSSEEPALKVLELELKRNLSKFLVSVMFSNTEYLWFLNY